MKVHTVPMLLQLLLLPVSGCWRAVLLLLLLMVTPMRQPQVALTC
jgi:hypothetical protein